MSSYKTSAILLRSYDFKDFDKIVVLYSREQGLIRAIAKGVKRSKSPLRGRLEPLMASHFVLYEGKNLDSITQCDTIESFKNIRKDLKKITFGLYYAELVTAFAVFSDPQSESFYNFVFDSLKMLEIADSDSMLETLLVEFEYKLISFAGYAPVFDTCNTCRCEVLEQSDVCFSTHYGMVVCSNCSKKTSNVILLTPELHQYLRYLASETKHPSTYDLVTVTKAHTLLFEYISRQTNYNLKTPKLIEALCLS